MSGTLYPGAPYPAEDLERQTGNQARDLARAIARIGELDCTRTLPGRLVWYERRCCKCGDQISPGWISFLSCAGEFCGPCWDPRAYVRVVFHAADCDVCQLLDVDTALANGDSR